MRRLVLAAAVLALIPSRSEAAPKVVRDQWLEMFQRDAKYGWGRVRIRENAAARAGEARFFSSTHWWTPVDVGKVEHGLVHERARCQSDARGRVLKYQARVETPWGVTRVDVRLVGTGMRYRVKVRAQPQLTGTIEGTVYDRQVIPLLLQRGELKLGRHSLPIIELPLKPTRSWQINATRTSEGIVLEDRVWRSHYDRKGFVRASSPLLPNAALRSAPKAQAKTIQPGQVVPQAARARTSLPFELKREGPGWLYGRSSGVLLLHAGTWCTLEVTGTKIALPRDAAARLRVAKQFQKNMVRSGFRPTSEPIATKYKQRPAIEWNGAWRQRGQEYQGRMTLVRVGAKGVFVLRGAPSDLLESTRPILDRAESFLTLSAQKPQTSRGQRFEIPGLGLSVQVPVGWTAKTSTRNAITLRNGPANLIAKQNTLAGKTVAEIQRSWMKILGRAFQGLRIVKSGPSWLGKRYCHELVVEGTSSNAKSGTRFRAQGHLFLVPDGPLHQRRYILVTTYGIEMSGGLEDLAKMRRSLRWSR